VLVGAFKTFQATGSAMACRINALQASGMTQLGMNCCLSIGALVVVLPTVWTVTDRTIENPEFEADIDEKIRTASE
jgi:hypothetical protein